MIEWNTLPTRSLSPSPRAAENNVGETSQAIVINRLDLLFDFCVSFIGADHYRLCMGKYMNPLKVNLWGHPYPNLLNVIVIRPHSFRGNSSSRKVGVRERANMVVIDRLGLCLVFFSCTRGLLRRKSEPLEHRHHSPP